MRAGVVGRGAVAVIAVRSPRKLIEVAMPLDAINAACVREKSIRNGHPSTLHPWWARRPLAAARAVIFAQMVNDPGFREYEGFSYGMPAELALVERLRLFGIIEDLVKWDNASNKEVLERARSEIRRSWREVCELNKDHPQASELFDPEKLPGFHDPFAGGGSIPLEAQRLGLESFASDLNPVAVLINKALIEIPQRFAGRAPVGPVSDDDKAVTLNADWNGTKGLAEDVRRYGAWMLAEAEKRIGHLYPKIEITDDMVRERPDLEPLLGKKLAVQVWLWARTVRSPNPAFGSVHVPLASTFVLSKMSGKQAYVEPVVENGHYRFVVKLGTSKNAVNGTSAGKRAAFRCLLSGSPIDYKYLREEGKAGRIGTTLLAAVATSNGRRVFLSPNDQHTLAALVPTPRWKPDTMLEGKCTDGVGSYGMITFRDLFTNRQLVALTTLTDLVDKVIANARKTCVSSGWPDDDRPLEQGGSGALAYAQAIGVYLALAISKSANSGSSLSSWITDQCILRATFSRHALPMVWDFAEVNPFSDVGGALLAVLGRVSGVVDLLPMQPTGYAVQNAAQTQRVSNSRLVSTDPPYFDNICYADLSDFFYVWLRHSLQSVYPSLFATLSTPKADELVAERSRHTSKESAQRFFLDGMGTALRTIADHCHPAFSITVYYAFKQSDTQQHVGTSSTGWESFLEAVHDSGFGLTGAWPLRTETHWRILANSANALASSIVLVLRKRDPNAPIISRGDFIRELYETLPKALDEITRGSSLGSPLAPVDVSQAIIGPGMAVFSKYSQVLEANGKPIKIKTVLQLINKFIAQDDFDHATQFCLEWFEQHGWDDGPFGEADVLARAKQSSVGILTTAGVAKSGGGKVRLVSPDNLLPDWDQKNKSQASVWELLHRMIAAIIKGGAGQAGQILMGVESKADGIRQLAYRLYTCCERRGRAGDARRYDDLVRAWGRISDVAREAMEPARQLEFGGVDK